MKTIAREHEIANSDVASTDAEDEALTIREQQIAQLVCGGLANKEIARKLSICEGTVKQHVHTIYRKLRIHGRGRLIVAMRTSQG